MILENYGHQYECPQCDKWYDREEWKVEGQHIKCPACGHLSRVLEVGAKWFTRTVKEQSAMSHDPAFPELPDFPDLENLPKIPKKRGPKTGSKNKPKKDPISGTNDALLNKLVNNDIVDKSVGNESLLDDIGYQVDFKSPMSLKELNFLEYRLSGEHSIKKSMDLAGYGGLTENYQYFLAKKIIRKYEASEGDHRKIFQAVGLGQVRVAEKISASMDSAESEHVQFNYTSLAAKCLGLSKDVEQASAGVTVIIQAQEGSAQQINLNTQAPGEVGSYDHPQPSQPGKPIMITK